MATRMQHGDVKAFGSESPALDASAATFNE
jgi:hypothetical protein